MPVECEDFGPINNDFEREIFDTLCRQFQTARGDYTVIGPSWVDGTDVDGILITPTGILTIEAKNVGVRLEKSSLNSPLKFYDESDQEIDLSDRHREAFHQASLQWKKVKNLLSKSLDGAELSVFVKSLLVVPNSSELQVTDELRNPKNYRAPAFILRLDEIPDFAQQFSPSRSTISRDVQNTILTIIREGSGSSLTPEQKSRAVMALAPPPPTPKPTPSSTGTGTQDKPPQYKPEPSPVQTPGPGTKTPKRSGRRNWVWLLFSVILAFGAYWLLSSAFDPLPSALLSVLILVGLLSRKWWAVIYAAVAGIAYSAMALSTSLTGLLPLVAALLWPLTLCAVIAYSFLGDEYLPESFDPSLPAIVVTEPVRIDNSTSTTDELPEPVPTYIDDTAVEDATAPASSTPAQETALSRLRVKGNSNVRSGPGETFDKIGVVLDGAEYVVIDSSADVNWYLIELENGNQVWIGSSRIELLSP